MLLVMACALDKRAIYFTGKREEGKQREQSDYRFQRNMTSQELGARRIRRSQPPPRQHELSCINKL
jgi:hypothetical protein